jgi:CheY-like chemotaxis protein/HPt (histidine-containing phosphotransfer) domain-containing protein
MPAYSISIANTLNGVISGSGAAKETVVKFIAPDAKVLIVDDINTNLLVAEGLLQPYKMQVELCSSGQEAIRAVEKKYYDIVFMDHMMPEMDGIEAAAAIRKLEMRNEESGKGRQQIPIIALTANAVIGMREMFIENGFNDFLTKPIDVSELDEMIDRWIPLEKKIVGNMEQGPGNRDYCSDNDNTSKLHPDSKGYNSPVISPQSLVPITGVDTAKGIALTGGKEEFYRRVLGLYRKDALERLPRLQTVPDADAMPVFITQVHSLKSASASIGAAEVSMQAAKLEAAGKSGDLAFIKDNLHSFTEHLMELVGNIRTALEPAQAAVPVPSGPDSPPPASSLFIAHCSLLFDLEAALKSQDAVEIDRLLDELNQKQLDSKTRETLEKISDDLLMAEFGNALKNIEELLPAGK